MADFYPQHEDFPHQAIGAAIGECTKEAIGECTKEGTNPCSPRASTSR